MGTTSTLGEHALRRAASEGGARVARAPILVRGTTQAVSKPSNSSSTTPLVLSLGKSSHTALPRGETPEPMRSLDSRMAQELEFALTTARSLDNSKSQFSS
jgi:hypothetical protein